MENEKAIEILANIRTQSLLDNKQEEADALFLGMRYLASITNRPYIKCKNCGKWYRRQVEKQDYDEFDINTYYCHCPYCGEEYEWNDCHWR
jgi:hypothetical protein